MSGLQKFSRFMGNTFAIWVVVVAAWAYFWPAAFAWIAPAIPPLLGVIMFGMGLTLSLGDFRAVARAPKSVLLGVLAQYLIMPLLAFALTQVLRLPQEAAVGVILVGCCPGGTASNVMTYLAKGDTALSVAVTTVSTLLSPILTPLLILLFASQWLDISAVDMFVSILEIVLLPIVAGVIVRGLFPRLVDQCNAALPLVSVTGIVVVVAAVVAVNVDALAQSGAIILLAVVLHNLLGLLFGFVVAKISGLPFYGQKAIAIEVGMQNSGLGASLAILYFSPLAAVPSAIFSVWHNISGPILATWWGRRAAAETPLDESQKAFATEQIAKANKPG